MSVAVEDLLIKYSVKTGTVGDSTAGTGNGSLGKYMSTTELVDASLNNLFDSVSSAESTNGDTEYRCLFIHNTNATSALINPRLWMFSQITGGSNISLGVDPTPASLIGAGPLQIKESTTSVRDSRTSSHTFSHTTTTGTQMLIVRMGLLSESGSGGFVTSMTFNGDAMTRASWVDPATGLPVQARTQITGLSVEFWYLVNPTITAGDIVIAHPIEDDILVCATNLGGVNVSNPTGMVAIWSNAGDYDPDVNITTDNSQTVFDVLNAVHTTQPNSAVGAGQTGEFDLEAFSNIISPVYSNLTGSYEFNSSNMSWNVPTGSPPIVGMVAVAINSSGPGGSGGIQAVEIANENIAPVGVDFSNPANYDGGLQLGTIPAGYCKAFWLRRFTEAGTSQQSLDNVIFKIAGG